MGLAGTRLARKARFSTETKLLLLQQHTVDRVDHVGQASSDFGYGDAQHSVSFSLKPGLPAHVVSTPRLVPVDRAVDFNRQSGRVAIEVHEIGADGLLTPEFPTVDFA